MKTINKMKLILIIQTIIIIWSLTIALPTLLKEPYEYEPPDKMEIFMNPHNSSEDDVINFVELFFPNISTGSSPLGNECFALSFIVKQYQCGFQNYGGKNLVAEVLKGPYNVDRIIGMNYNYFVGPDAFTNYNVTLVVREGRLIDAVVEKYGDIIAWG